MLVAMTHSLSFEPPRPRQFGAVNWLGLGVLTGKEIRRFIKVYAQTIVAPMISTLLFYVVFAVALGNNGRMIEGVPYMTFLVPGLVMMSMGQNAFANTSSAIVIAKVQGNIVDVLMPPLSAGELTAGFTIGGIMRGLAVGLISILVLAPVADLPFQHPFFIVYNALLGSMMLALIGLIGGIWADKFDHMATVQNFIIMPATFLSGTFYTADRLLHDRRIPVWFYRSFERRSGDRTGSSGRQRYSSFAGGIPHVRGGV
jgi:ABC-2 type transport system permease protein